MKEYLVLFRNFFFKSYFKFSGIYKFFVYYLLLVKYIIFKKHTYKTNCWCFIC